MLTVKSAVNQTVLLVIVTVGLLGWVPARRTTFLLYRMDKSCVCVKTKKQTKTLRATEARTGKFVYQVFWSRTEPKRELFRIRVGTAVGSGEEKWWNYGIADEADFNGDGVPDYSWYGGDDTGFEMHLSLSSRNGYTKVDVLKTVQAAWKRRFRTAAPDLGEAGGSYSVSDTLIERSAKGLMLLVKIERVALDGKVEGVYRFRIPEADFRS